MRAMDSSVAGLDGYQLQVQGVHLALRDFASSAKEDILFESLEELVGDVIA